MANTTTSYQEGSFHPSTSQGITAMAPPLVPRGSTYSHYLHHNRNDDFGFPNNERPINLPPVYSAETPLLTPLDLLAPQEPSSPGSPLVEMWKNLSAMQNIISQRLLLAKEYGTAAIEGATRKAEWERDRARRMEQSRGAGSTGAPKNATPNTPYIDWSPISAGVVPLAYRLPTFYCQSATEQDDYSAYGCYISSRNLKNGAPESIPTIMRKCVANLLCNPRPAPCSIRPSPPYNPILRPQSNEWDIRSPRRKYIRPFVYQLV